MRPHSPTPTSPQRARCQGSPVHPGLRVRCDARRGKLRVAGLIHTLAVKFAQDDVHIVRDLEIPSGDSKYIEDLVDDRQWEITTLFVDSEDIFPENITQATDGIFHMNLMPVHGLNVHSMLKHKTLVLTLSALEMLEEKLIFAHRRLDVLDKRLRSNNPAESIYKHVR